MRGPPGVTSRTPLVRGLRPTGADNHIGMTYTASDDRGAWLPPRRGHPTLCTHSGPPNSSRALAPGGTAQSGYTW